MSCLAERHTLGTIVGSSLTVRLLRPLRLVKTLEKGPVLRALGGCRATSPRVSWRPWAAPPARESRGDRGHQPASLVETVGVCLFVRVAVCRCLVPSDRACGRMGEDASSARQGHVTDGKGFDTETC